MTRRPPVLRPRGAGALAVTRVLRMRGTGVRPALRRSVAVGVLLVVLPGVAGATAVAADGDPEPTSWPTVAQPSSGTDQSDPEPTAAPTVAQPDTGEALDPAPVDWPAPEPG